MTDESIIMQKAESFLGLTTHPTGSTNVIFNTDYYGKEISEPDWFWCVVFIWDVFRMCGKSHLFNNGEKTNRCDAVYKWGKENNLIIPNDEGRYGDLAIYILEDQPFAHIGLIYENNGDGSYTTYEGNTTPYIDSMERGVFRKTRYLKDIQYIIRPKYNENTVELSFL